MSAISFLFVFHYSSLNHRKSRGNYFTGFLTVDISNDNIELTSYNETGTKNFMKNFNYTLNGKLTVKKGGNLKSIDGYGTLKPLNRVKALMHFTFEEIVSLRNRPVLGVRGSCSVCGAPIVNQLEVRGVKCHKSLPNIGEFGQNYDAQVNNLILVPGVHGKAAKFGLDSRAAISGMGPFGEGSVASFALWFNSESIEKVVLASYEGCWIKKDVLTLHLQAGALELSFSATQVLRTILKNKLNDGKWHHVVVNMPYRDCLLSEIQIYLNGELLPPVLDGYDKPVNLPNAGLFSLGGFGYAGSCAKINNYVRNGYQQGTYFTGMLDEVHVYGRSLSAVEIQKLAWRETSGYFFQIKRANGESNQCIGLGSRGNWKTLTLWECTQHFGQQWIQESTGIIRNRFAPKYCITHIESSSKKLLKVETCDKSAIWKVVNDNIIKYISDPNSNKVMTRGKGLYSDSVILKENTGDTDQQWRFAMV